MSNQPAGMISAIRHVSSCNEAGSTPWIAPSSWMNPSCGPTSDTQACSRTGCPSQSTTRLVCPRMRPFGRLGEWLQAEVGEFLRVFFPDNTMQWQYVNIVDCVPRVHHVWEFPLTVTTSQQIKTGFSHNSPVARSVTYFLWEVHFCDGLVIIRVYRCS